MADEQVFFRKSAACWREQRRFGVGVGLAAAVLGSVVVWRAGTTLGWLLAGVGGLFVGVGLVRPQALGRLRQAWMRVGEGLGVVTAHLVLAVIFFTIVTPLGVAMRLVGYDPLGRRRRGAQSYWVPYPERQRDARHYEKLF